MQLDGRLCCCDLCSVQQKLASAQEDGERGLRSLADRSAREAEAEADKSERAVALGDLRRQADLEASEARAVAANERADQAAEQKHARKASVNIAINLAEEERSANIHSAT